MRRRFNKITLVATLIGRIGPTGAGGDQAHGAGDERPEGAMGDVLFLECEQSFSGSSLIEVNGPVTTGGKSMTSVGNFCTQVAPSR